MTTITDTIPNYEVVKPTNYPNCQLRVTIHTEKDFSLTCDGCGKKHKVNEKYVTDIESCCGGGCSRNLCSNCITTVYKLLGSKT